ncbi:MAG: RNA polymerase sigma factor [bacterium]|nr:RNA polymerase sigma factor [candidate division KSB1 bacterium]MDH7560442.1 RNA polymerase sigma factor [bacterium]
MRQSHFTTMVLAYKDRIYSQAYYFLGNRPDAEDVTQEVLLRAWQHFDAIRKPTLKAWLMRVTHNLCIDSLRRHKAERAVVSDDELGEATKAVPTQEIEHDPHRVAEQQELKDCLEEAIRRLPPRLRSIIIMREWLDMKYEEISAALGIPMNSVKVYIHRGRKQLRMALGEMAEEVRG